MAQAARTSWPNPCAAGFPPARPLPAGRPDATPRLVLLSKGEPCSDGAHLAKYEKAPGDVKQLFYGYEDVTSEVKTESNKPKEVSKIFDMTVQKQKQRGSFSLDTAHSPCKSATRPLTCGGLVLDSPPGFSLHISSSFARPQFHRESAESCSVDSSTNLALDTPGLVPDVPQFTATHRELNTNDTITCSESENGGIGTQIFVKFGAYNISLQENLKGLSVKDLRQSILRRVGVRISDFYFKCSGKYLDEENFISDYAIRNDSTIEVCYRLRAGTREQLIVFQTWNEVIVGKPRHHSVYLPPELIGAEYTKQGVHKAVLLSGFIQYYCGETLAALCEVYSRGFSLDGRFTPHDILFCNGKAFFADSVREVPFTGSACRSDFLVIHNIFQPVFWDEVNELWPLHTEHLLDFLWNCPVDFYSRSKKAIVFLTNHPAVLTYSARISMCLNLHGMIQRLRATEYKTFLGCIKSPHWMMDVSGVAAMRIVLEYGSRVNPYNGFRILTYSSDGDQALHFATNYFKHAKLIFSREQLEASFSMITSDENNYLADLLQEIALDPGMPPEIDLVEILGNNRLEGMERNPLLGN